MGKLYQYIEVLECQLIISHFPEPPDLLFVIALDIPPQYHMIHSATKAACLGLPSRILSNIRDCLHKQSHSVMFQYSDRRVYGGHSPTWQAEERCSLNANRPSRDSLPMKGVEGHMRGVGHSIC